MCQLKMLEGRDVKVRKRLHSSMGDLKHVCFACPVLYDLRLLVYIVVPVVVNLVTFCLVSRIFRRFLKS